MHLSMQVCTDNFLRLLLVAEIIYMYVLNFSTSYKSSITV